MWRVGFTKIVIYCKIYLTPGCKTYNSKLDFFFLEFFLNREDTKADNEISKPITSILHEEDALDYDEYDEEKSEGMLFL